MRGLALCGAAIAALLAGPALAQAPGAPTPGQAQPPRSETGPRAPATRGDLSDGVIRPPANIDPAIRTPAPVPNPGTTPVIPPPGTPGGDRSVQPR